MKASFSAVCATAVVVFVSAYAETRTSPQLHPASLARTEAITSYCEKVDPDSDSLYLSRLTAKMRGHSVAEIQRDRDSLEYREALAQAHETLTKTRPGTAIKACSEFLAQK
ncbi:MAG TPA: hypothetical protein VGG85_16930 [Terracidiphilus sp.]|jgi:hypothetical protein